VSSGLVWDFLEKRRGLIDGVVISGGEPTLYPYLRDVISEIHAMGYRVKLDTNGLMPQVAKSFAPDYIALDIKTLPSMYGVQLKAGVQDVEGRLADSVNLIRQMGDNAEVRITVAPGIVDLYVVEGLCRLLAGVRKIMLQPMDQRAPLLDPEYNKIAPVPEKEILVMRNMLAKVAEYCGIRGTPG
jgi:pyruvate formate lyase activating enzyme